MFRTVGTPRGNPILRFTQVFVMVDTERSWWVNPNNTWWGRWFVDGGKKGWW